MVYRLSGGAGTDHRPHAWKSIYLNLLQCIQFIILNSNILIDITLSAYLLRCLNLKQEKITTSVNQVYNIIQNIQITMIYGHNQYGHLPPVLKQFISEYTEHEHVPKKSDSALESIMHDHGITAFHIGERVLKGAALGLFASFVGSFWRVADKKILVDRMHKDRFRFFVRRARLNVAIGGLIGLGWYFIHDQMLCPHGQSTLQRNLIAHAVAGSILYAAFWSPSNFFIGGIVGLLFGLKNETLLRKGLPKDLQIQFGTVNEEARRKALHDEREINMSYKLISGVFKNNYAL